MKMQSFFGGIIALCIFAVVLEEGAAHASHPTEEAQQRIHAILHDVTTEDALSQHAENRAAMCVNISTDSKICTWYISNRRRAWRGLAEVLDTKYQVTLVCELPTNGENRSPGSCRAYPRSFRDGDFYYGGISMEKRQAAVERLADAQTLWPVIDLVGTGPEECFFLADDKLTCRWHVTRSVLGYTLVLLNTKGKRNQKMHFECTFPADGGEREEDSCQVR